MIEFKISDSKVLKIYLPCESDELGWWSDISIKYSTDGMEFDLYVNDFVSEAIKALNNVLDKAIEGKLRIKEEYVEKGIGFYRNIHAHELWTKENSDIEDPVYNFTIWSTPSHIGIETYMYNKQDEIYIEISPIYKWHSDHPEDETEYETFEQFLSSYKTIDILKINKDTAALWRKECQNILDIAAQNSN